MKISDDNIIWNYAFCHVAKQELLRKICTLLQLLLQISMVMYVLDDCCPAVYYLLNILILSLNYGNEKNWNKTKIRAQKWIRQ